MRTLTLNHIEVAAWLRLTTTPGISRALARGLLAALGAPQNIFAAPRSALSAIVGSTAAGIVLQAPPPELAARVAATVAWLAQTNCHLVTLADPAYPPMLLNSSDPPILLYVRGRLRLLHTTALAMVGSRQASPQGLANAHRFAAALAHAGLTIVSGMALGIDGAAHQGALSTGGATVAVLGTGVNRVYPSRHAALAQQLAEHGALISEWPLDAPPLPAHFPQRNRLIAGLARAVLVVEAAAQSGSLITARLANEMGRDVYAVPGSIHATLTKGCHHLIKEGAKLVESVHDVLQELDWSAEPVRAPSKPNVGSLQPVAPLRDALPLNADANGDAGAGAGGNSDSNTNADTDAVLLALGHDAAAPDLLAERTGLSVGRLQAALLTLELAGRIALLPCGRIASHFGRGAAPLSPGGSPR
jgi:DNA processing protein